jgi:hypothetical protein
VSVYLPGGADVTDTSNTTIIIQAPINPAPTSDTTPRIMLWPGKVNQHTDANGAWQTDPDGRSGGHSYLEYSNDYAGRELDYCKKWYPNTTSVAPYKSETIDTWHEGGNINNWTGTFISYKCGQGGVVSAPSITVLSPNGGEVYQAGQQISVKWTTGNVPQGWRPSIVLDDKRTNSIGGIILAQNTENDGTEVVNLPSSTTWTGMEYGTFYQVRVAFANGGGSGSFDYADESNNLFTIQTPSTSGCAINSFTADPMTIPVGGASTLAWSTSGCNSVVIDHGEAVTNNLSSSGSLSTATTLFGNPNPNTYTLRVSTTPGCYGTPYSNTNGQPCTYLTQALTISIQSTTCTANSTPSINLISPNGETYKNGESIMVKWETCNIPATALIQVMYGGSTGPSGFFAVGASATPNDGNQMFILPSVELLPIGTYTMRLCVDAGGPWECSGELSNPGVFTINATGGKLAPVTTSTNINKFTFTKKLNVGSKGIDVVTLQNRLKSEGVFTGTASGYYGLVTKEAVKKLQLKYELSPVGVVGPKTLEILNK